MKNIIRNFLLMALLIAHSGALFAQSVSKTFTKSFHLDGHKTVQLDLPGNIEVKKWDSPTLRFEITVSTGGNCSAAMLDELARVGRYDIVMHPQGGLAHIDAPNLKRTVKAKGSEIKENIGFVVFAPQNVQIVLPTSALTAATPQ